MKQHLKWLAPIFFVLLGVFLFTTVHGHDFLGLLSCGIAAVISCYYLLALLHRHNASAAKWLKISFTVLLCIGVAAFMITEIVILDASSGDGKQDFDYLIVLGAKVNGTSPSLSLNDRIQAAYAYLTDHPDVTAVLSGGQGADEGISEAECMFNELTRLGISPDRLLLEDKATSTWENLQFSLAIIEEKTGKRPDTIGLLSSEYHLFRAKLTASACGIEATTIPARTGWPTICINYFLREVPAVWKYIIFGG